MNETLYKSDNYVIVRNEFRIILILIPATDPSGGKYWATGLTVEKGPIYNCICEILKVKQ